MTGRAANLSTEEECVALAAFVAEREERVHVLVNNAGATWGAPLEEFPASAWDKVLDLNLKAPFFLTRAFLPLLENGGDRGRPGPDRERRVHRRAARAADADVLVLRLEGRRAPADPRPRPRARAAAHHRQRRRARAVPFEDDGRDAGRVRPGQSRPTRRCAASAATTTWPVSRSTSRPRRRRTSPAR